MSTPRPDHPWYGRNNHVKRKARSIRDALIDREIERAIQLERLASDVDDLDGTLRPSRDPSYSVIDGGLRRVPVRYDSGE
jgi:hypothetical protein